MKHIEIVKKKEAVVERGPKKPQKLKVIVLRKVRQGEEFVKKEEIPVSIGIPQYYEDLQSVEQERKKKEEEFHEKTFIYLIGGFNSGKETICEKILEDFEICQIVPSELIKAEAGKDTDIGKQIKSILSENKEIPAEIVISLIKQEILKQGKQSYIMPDFPANEEYLELFEEKVCPCKVCFSLETNEETILEKLAKKAEEEGKEENLDEVKEKIASVKKQNEPAIAYFTEKEKVVSIDANRPVEEVYEDIKNKLCEFVVAITHEQPEDE